MARRSKNLSNAFERFSNTEPIQEDVTVNSNTESVQGDVIVKRNTEPVQNDVTVKRNTESVQGDVIVKRNTESVQNDVTVNSNTDTSSNSKQRDETNTTFKDIKQDLLSIYEEKTKKETVEDTHIRTTFLFRKDLAKRLDKLSKNKRGFKTMFINKAIEALLEEMGEE